MKITTECTRFATSFGRELNAMDQVLGVMLIIVLVGVLADRYVFRPVERYFQTTRGLAWGYAGTVMGRYLS